MEWLVKYIMVVCSAGIISLILDGIIPESNIKKAARFGIALIMTLMICTPILTLITGKNLQLPTRSIETSVDLNRLKDQTKTAITRLVRLSNAFSQADVDIEMQQTQITEITIYNKNSSIIDSLKMKAAEDELKKYLSVLYGVEVNKIIIVQG